MIIECLQLNVLFEAAVINVWAEDPESLHNTCREFMMSILFS